MRFDIERDALGHDAQGKPIYLNHLWPSDEEIDAVVGRAVKPEQFKQSISRCLNWMRHKARARRCMTGGR